MANQPINKTAASHQDTAAVLRPTTDNQQLTTALLRLQPLDHVEQVLAHGARTGNCVSDCYVADLSSLEHRHPSELTLVHHVDRRHAIACRQHPVVRRWSPAALGVPQVHAARLVAGALLN